MLCDTYQIPKIIHWCWLGGGGYPPLVRKCIESWRKFMPDYEIICWDRDRFDINSVLFVKEACEQCKWAFAADYIRLYALYNYGGIYLDSDVLVLKSFDKFLNFGAFSAIEHCLSSNRFTCNIEAAIIGARAGHPWMKSCLDYYENRCFVNDDNTLNIKIIPEIIADIAEDEFGFKRQLIEQILREDIHVFTPAVFAHAYIETRTMNCCHAIHLCEGGWYEKKRSVSLKKIKSLLLRFFFHPVKTIYLLYWRRKICKLLEDS